MEPNSNLDTNAELAVLAYFVFLFQHLLSSGVKQPKTLKLSRYISIWKVYKGQFLF